MKKFNYCILILVLLSACYNSSKELVNFKNSNEVLKDFKFRCNRRIYSVLVRRPRFESNKYPLVIYHHGQAIQTVESLQLDSIADRLAEQGYLVWIPVREPWQPNYLEELLEESGAVAKEVFKGAIISPVVDKENINIVGYSLGSCGVFKENLRSNQVKKIALIGFGPPMDDIFLFGKVYKTIKETVYENISAEVLLMATKSDEKIDLGPVEYTRKKMEEAQVNVTTVEYKYKLHSELSGDKEYLKDVIRFLKGEKLKNTVNKIELNTKMIQKWDRLRRTGYW